MKALGPIPSNEGKSPTRLISKGIRVAQKTRQRF